jgi:hypothetical protein
VGGKRLELLRQIVPDLKSIAVLLSMQSRYQDLSLLRETGLAARHLGLSCCLIAPVEGSEKIEDAFDELSKSMPMQSTCSQYRSFFASGPRSPSLD